MRAGKGCYLSYDSNQESGQGQDNPRPATRPSHRRALLRLCNFWRPPSSAAESYNLKSLHCKISGLIPVTVSGICKYLVQVPAFRDWLATTWRDHCGRDFHLHLRGKYIGCGDNMKSTQIRRRRSCATATTGVP